MEITSFTEPYTHYVIDNFLNEEQALELSNEFMDYNSPNWFVYDNPLEIKKTCNNFYFFPPKTYQFFQFLNSPQFLNAITDITGIKDLLPDVGLHGAGWHIQGQGSKLNVHLDYSIHPKLKLQRKLNLIYYLTPNWDNNWGGNLELWSHDDEKNQPKNLVKTVYNKFNRVILFDTSQNSWHGFSKPMTCPDNIYRKSIAMYYLVPPAEGVSERSRALYAPSEEQKNDLNILNLIEKRVK
jgi:hypothetical protein